MREDIEKRVRKYAIIAGSTIFLGSTIAGLKLLDYYLMMAHYRGLEEVRGREVACATAERYLKENSGLLVKMLLFPEVKATEDYLRDSSKEKKDI